MPSGNKMIKTIRYPRMWRYGILTCEDIDDSLIWSLSLQLLLGSLVESKHRNIIGPSSKVIGKVRKSSEIFGNFGNSPKMFENVCLAFGKIFEKLRKSSESGQKYSENHRKRPRQYIYIIKRTLHVRSKIWILCSRGKNNISILFLPLEHEIHIFSPPRNIP